MNRNDLLFWSRTFQWSIIPLNYQKRIIPILLQFFLKNDWFLSSLKDVFNMEKIVK